MRLNPEYGGKGQIRVLPSWDLTGGPADFTRTRYLTVFEKMSLQATPGRSLGYGYLRKALTGSK